MAATAVVPDLASSTGIEEYLRSREELANQVAVLRLGGAAAAAKAWRELLADLIDAPGLGESVHLEESLRERFERLNGRPLVVACPTGCTCRGQAADAVPEQVS
jgi:hypothetical protein